ncbi:MAG: helix-turn-helix transcriptional regulator [Magnetovibrionaceae bacterium]
MSERLLSRNEVIQKTSLSRSTIDRLESAGEFPKRITVSASRVAWLESEINQFVQSRVAVRDSSV